MTHKKEVFQNKYTCFSFSAVFFYRKLISIFHTFFDRKFKKRESIRAGTPSWVFASANSSLSSQSSNAANKAIPSLFFCYHPVDCCVFPFQHKESIFKADILFSSISSLSPFSVYIFCAFFLFCFFQQS